MQVTVKTDRARIRARVKAGISYILPIITEKVLSDCNRYAPQDCNILRCSAAVNTEIRDKYPIKENTPKEKLALLDTAEGSDIKEGRIVWDVPYAKKRYYVGKPSHDENGNAALLWCEVAHDNHGKDWRKAAQKAFSIGMGK